MCIMHYGVRMCMCKRKRVSKGKGKGMSLDIPLACVRPDVCVVERLHAVRLQGVQLIAAHAAV